MSGWLLMVDALMQEGERNSGRSSLLAHFVHHQLKGSRASGPTADLKPVLFCCTCSSSPPLPLPCHLPVIPAPRPCFIVETDPAVKTMSTAAYIFLLLGRADASALAGARTHCRLLLCRPREHDRRKSPLSLIDFPHLARALQCSGAKIRPASFATAQALSKGVGFSLPACRRAPARTLGFRQARLRLRPPVLMSAYSLALLAGLVDGPDASIRAAAAAGSFAPS